MRAHVLILVSTYVTSEDPRRGAKFRDHLLHYRAKGWEVGLVAVSQMGASLFQLARRGSLTSWSNEAGAPVLRSYLFSSLLNPVLRRLNHSVTPAALRWSGRRAVDAYVRRHGRPDLIHAHGTFGAGEVAFAVHHQLGIPYVLTEHISDFLKENALSPKMVERALPVVADAALRMPVSGALGLNMEATFGEAMRPWTPVPNIVDGRFLQLPLSHRRDGEFVVFSVSYLTRKKRPEVLVRAFAEAFAGQKAELRLGGDGPEVESVRSLAQELGVSSQITYLGPLAREEVAREMERCSVYALSSEVETFGIPVIEAMAAGKPVVATFCGGPDELIDDTSGILVDVGSVSDFAAGLIAIRDAYGIYDQRLIRANCEARFSAEAVLTKIEKIYDRYGARV